MRDADTTVVHRGQAPVHEMARVVSCSPRAELQRGCRACGKTTIPMIHASSGGVTKLTNEIGALVPINIFI